MSNEQKRAEVTKLYPGPGWARKVKRMSDAQVYAIWAKKQKDSEKKVETNDESDPGIPF